MFMKDFLIYFLLFWNTISKQESQPKWLYVSSIMQWLGIHD